MSYYQTTNGKRYGPYLRKFVQRLCKVCGVLYSPRRKTQKYCSWNCSARAKSKSRLFSKLMRARLVLDISKTELLELYHEKQHSIAEIALLKASSYKHVWRLLRHYQITRRVAAKRNQTGAMNSSWKGGKVKDSHSGYWYVKHVGHHRTTRGGYVAEHILVAEKTLGRPVNNDEVVHHIDGDRNNNSAENLYVIKKDRHPLLHKQLETIGLALFKQGRVLFDDGEYRLC